MDHFNLTFKQKDNDQNPKNIEHEKIHFDPKRDQRNGLTTLDQENQISPHTEPTTEDTPGEA